MEDVNKLMGRLEFQLTKAFLRYAAGQRFGYTLPSHILNNIESEKSYPEASQRFHFGIHTEVATDSFYLHALQEAQAGDLGNFLTEVSPQIPLFKTLKQDYLAAKKMMDVYQCNAFTTACHELCTSEIPQNRKFTPCMAHSLLNGEGIPSGCEEDLNALVAMCILQYLGNRPCFMGNPNHETDELLRIHHAVPALCMNGYGTKPLSYKLWAFTGQGFGGKLQIDFTENEQDKVTLGRFNPAGDTMIVKTGEVLRSEYDEVYCSPYYYIQMDDARTFMHDLAGFGHHQVLAFGDYAKEVKELSRYMHFNVLESGK